MPVQEVGLVLGTRDMHRLMGDHHTQLLCVGVPQSLTHPRDLRG
jgi:hypothetical protein